MSMDGVVNVKVTMGEPQIVLAVEMSSAVDVEVDMGDGSLEFRLDMKDDKE